VAGGEPPMEASTGIAKPTSTAVTARRLTRWMTSTASSKLHGARVTRNEVSSLSCACAQMRAHLQVWAAIDGGESFTPPWLPRSSAMPSGASADNPQSALHALPPARRAGCPTTRGIAGIFVPDYDALNFQAGRLRVDPTAGLLGATAFPRLSETVQARARFPNQP
jgi:hypothetical protein